MEVQRTKIDKWIAEQFDVDDISKVPRPDMAKFLEENPIPENIQRDQYTDLLENCPRPYRDKINVAEFYQYLHSLNYQ